MKVKRFKNIWTMGLIIFGVILVAFYIVKLVCPNFIIGVAEHPGIVAFGNYIDSHLWSYYLFNGLMCYIGGYIYCCACCRTHKLNLKGNLLLLLFIVISLIFQRFGFELYTPFNYVNFILLPFLILLCDKKLTKETFTSTICCYTIDIMAQAMSLVIRNVVIMTIHPNCATLSILLIDTWIWRILLYCYFNYKIK